MTLSAVPIEYAKALISFHNPLLLLFKNKTGNEEQEGA
jgi:hypothetical protein